jgi:hypothetical protein
MIQSPLNNVTSWDLHLLHMNLCERHFTSKPLQHLSSTSKILLIPVIPLDAVNLNPEHSFHYFFLLWMGNLKWTDFQFAVCPLLDHPLLMFSIVFLFIYCIFQLQKSFLLFLRIFVYWSFRFVRELFCNVVEFAIFVHLHHPELLKKNYFPFLLCNL